MSWVLDILVIALIVGTILYYTKRGFVKTLLGFGRTLVSFVLAWAFGPKLGAVISQRIIGEKITQRIYELLSSLFDGAAETFDLSQLFSRLPEDFVKVVERCGGNMAELEAKYGDMTAASRENLLQLSQTIASPITTLISNLLGYLLIFLLTFFVFFLCSGLIAKIFELPILKQVNSILGFVLGVLFAVLNVFVFCFLAAPLLRFIGAATGKFIADIWIEGSHLFKWIAGLSFF